jgi:hypothetical protein
MRMGGALVGEVMQSWAPCHKAFLAAKSTRRWKKAPSMRPSGWDPTTTRSWASTRWLRTTTTPDGGKAARRWTSSSTRRPLTPCRLKTRPSSMPPANMRQPTCWPSTMRSTPKALKQLAAAKTKVLPFRSKCWKPRSRPPWRCLPRTMPRAPSGRRSTPTCATSSDQRDQVLWFRFADARQGHQESAHGPHGTALCGGGNTQKDGAQYQEDQQQGWNQHKSHALGHA